MILRHTTSNFRLDFKETTTMLPVLQMQQETTTTTTHNMLVGPDLVIF